MFIHEISVGNLLSFGPNIVRLDLRPLNVLIGPNGSGKSNLLEVISLLQSAPKHLAGPVRDRGGISDWLHKGSKKPTASIEVVVDNPKGSVPLRHAIQFTETSRRFELVDERIENKEPYPGQEDVYFYYRFQHNHPVLNVKGEKTPRQLRREDVDPEKSILAQRKDPDVYPELTYLGEQYERTRMYREWSFGRYAAPRLPQKADDRNDFLAEDCHNLGLVLNRLRSKPTVKRQVLDGLRQLYHGIDDFYESIEGGTVQVFLQEGRVAIPATRLSDGTLRYLSLLAILVDPDPPPLVCIEEPELGLHPDVIPGIARLLKEAAQRMQLVVTTHSDILIDELSDQPESVVVCEKEGGATRMSRLSSKQLAVWLEKYRLGQLWTKGQFGGTRW